MSSDSARATSSLSRSSRSATRCSRAPRSRRRGARPGPVVEGARGRRRSRPRCPRARPRRPRPPACRPPGSGSPGARPSRALTHRPRCRAPARRGIRPLRSALVGHRVAYVATRCARTQQDLRLWHRAVKRRTVGIRNPAVCDTSSAASLHHRYQLLDPQVRPSRNVGPETLIDAMTSPWALRIGAATAVSPTSSSSTATAYPCSRTSASSRRSLALVVTVSGGVRRQPRRAGCRPRRRTGR